MAGANVVNRFPIGVVVARLDRADARSNPERASLRPCAAVARELAFSTPDGS
jgi:hypothetical protein